MSVMVSGRTLAAFFLCSALLPAAVTRIVIEKRESPAYEGRVFGKAGQYELLSGHFYGEVNPKDPHNTIITDIQLAPRNARGNVEYVGTFAIARPIDPAKASGVLIYQVANRGNGAPQPDEDGHISVVSGWQGDVKPREGIQSIQVAAAKNADGSPITGSVFERLVNMPAGASTVTLNTAPYIALTYQIPVSLDTTKATLTRRARDGAGTVVNPDDWRFADCSATPFPGTPDEHRICMKGGFDPTYAYELVYTAKDPLVLGIGYAATRDLISYLRFDKSAGNPVASQVRWTIGRGSSQSGNFLRSFIHLGFNQDEARRMVFDGAHPHIAARQLVLNIRFGLPGGAAGVNEPGSEAALWWGDYEDKARGRKKASLLDRCRATNTCPKIFETFGGLEFWYLRESPNLVGTDAKQDIPLPANVRRYYLPSTTHGGGRGGFNVQVANAARGCLLPANPNPESDTMRALGVALVDWVTKGVEPPPSHYPRLDRGELLEPASVAAAFPKIPGAPTPEGLVNKVLDNDFGSGFSYSDLSGIVTRVPATVKQALPTLVPKIDADGMDAVDGVASVLRQAPLGSYLGWDPIAGGFDAGKQCELTGGYIPFAKTKAERTASGDPRLSLEERYKDHAGYVAVVKAAAAKAVKDRFLLQEDADRLVAEADKSAVLR
jgi:hypothetical protein